jgi:hypothetical protein
MQNMDALLENPAMTSDDRQSLETIILLGPGLPPETRFCPVCPSDFLTLFRFTKNNRKRKETNMNFVHGMDYGGI